MVLLLAIMVGPGQLKKRKRKSFIEELAGCFVGKPHSLGNSLSIGLNSLKCNPLK